MAVRLVVERERAIEAFTPMRAGRSALALRPRSKLHTELAEKWESFRNTLDAKGKGPTLKRQNQWMNEAKAVRGELAELGGEKFRLGCTADEPKDLSEKIEAVVRACGFDSVDVTSEEDPEGKGPARFRRSVSGTLLPEARYRVRSIETRQSSSKPSAPFITSSLQIAASNQLGYSAQRTMRLAQDLYEGVNLSGEGQVALITYMRTDSTNISERRWARYGATSTKSLATAT